MEDTGNNINLLNHFDLHPIVELNFFGIDLSINQAVIWIWISSGIVCFLLLLAARTMKRYPAGIQNFVEMIVEFSMKGLILDVIGEEGRPWFPIIATIFLFILTINFLGLIPGSYTATTNINVTASLALLVFLVVQWAGISRHGLKSYLKGFIPTGVPRWILPILIPIEVIGMLAKPFSLAVRLFANMLAGHMVILGFLTIIILFKSYLIAPVPIAGVIVISGFEIFVSFIQAYIFAILTASYIAEAVHASH